MVRKELQLPAGFELVQPDRQVIKEGDLDDVRGTWLPSGNGELKKRTYFLFNDLLMKGQLATGADAPCAYRGMIKIDHTSIICRGRARMHQKWYPAFSLRGRGEGDGDEWVMLAETNDDREEWVSALNRCRNWKHSFAVDYAKKMALEQAAKDKEVAQREKTNKRAARRASLEPGLNAYSLDRFDEFLAAQAGAAHSASTTASQSEPEPEPEPEPGAGAGAGGGRTRQSTESALEDIDHALAQSLSSIATTATAGAAKSSDEEEDEMPTVTCVPLPLGVCLPVCLPACQPACRCLRLNIVMRSDASCTERYTVVARG